MSFGRDTRPKTGSTSRVAAATMSALTLVERMRELLRGLPKAQLAELEGIADALTRQVHVIGHDSVRNELEGLHRAISAEKAEPPNAKTHTGLSALEGALRNLRKHASLAGLPAISKAPPHPAPFGQPPIRRVQELPEVALSDDLAAVEFAGSAAAHRPLPPTPRAALSKAEENRISFEEIAAEFDALFASVARQAGPDGLDEVDMGWFSPGDGDDHDDEGGEDFDEIPHSARQGGDLAHAETTRRVTAPGADGGEADEDEAFEEALAIVTAKDVDDGLLPSSDTSFEDSGLFVVFVDEANIADVSSGERAFKQFVNHLQKILRRLGDSLELGLVHREWNELIDVHRQLNRAVRLLSFVDLDRQTSLIVYVQELLPIRHGPWPSRVPEEIPGREIVPELLEKFASRIPEVINCLTYFFGYLIHEIPGLDRTIFEDMFVRLYDGLGLPPAEPSSAAPLGPYGTGDEIVLTSRTRAMLARAYEIRLDEFIRRVEATMLHARTAGYREAAMYCTEMFRIAEEYGLPHISAPLGRLAQVFDQLRPTDRPGHELIGDLTAVVDSLSKMLPTFSGRHFVDQASTLFERVSFTERERTGRFDRTGKLRSQDTFATAWPQFLRASSHALEALLDVGGTSDASFLEHLRALRGAAATQGITLLERLFNTLEEYWHRAPEACSHVAQDLAASIRALPTSGAQYAQLEALARSVVQDLVQRRSNALRTPHQHSKELGAAVLRIVKQLGDLVELVRVAVKGDLGRRLSSLRSASLELAGECRRHELHALGIACEVITELALAELNQATDPIVRRSLEEAGRKLEDVVKGTLVRIEQFESGGSALGSIDTYFGQFTSHNAEGTRQDLALDFALSEVAGGLLVSIEDFWDGIPTDVQLNEIERAAYGETLNHLEHLVYTWGRRELYEKVVEHIAALSHAIDVKRVAVVRRSASALAAAVERALPAVPPTMLLEAGESFLIEAPRLHRRISYMLAQGQPNIDENAWSVVAHAAVEVLLPLARESLFVPFIAIACELNDVVVASATEARSAHARTRAEAILFWLQNIVTTILPKTRDDDRDDGEGAREYGPLVRVPADAMAQLRGAVHSLGSHLELLEALIDEGPLKLAGKEGREALASFQSLIHQLDESVAPLSPERVGDQLDRLAAVCEDRARMQGKNVLVEVRHSDADEETIGQQLHAIERVIAGLDSIAEAAIDYAFPAESPEGTLELHLDVSPGGTTGIVRHNGDGQTEQFYMDILAAMGTPVSDSAVLASTFCESPEAIQAVAGGACLAWAYTMVAKVDGRLRISSRDGWTSFTLSLPSS